MAQRTVFTITLAALLGFGCAVAHPSDEVRTGIYELTVETMTDDCSPQRAAGDLGMVAVLVRDGAIDAPVPETDLSLFTAPRVELTPGRSYHFETNRRLTGCDGAWVHEEWTMMDSDGTVFEVDHSQDWEGVSSCVPAEGSSVPSVDCAVDRHLRYALDTACDAPCSLSIDASGALICGC
ncbi:MAG: hypothetical protein AB7S26_39825 [Sandaracinaceae bacterium]